jgi:hypothetical protein
VSEHDQAGEERNEAFEGFCCRQRGGHLAALCSLRGVRRHGQCTAKKVTLLGTGSPTRNPTRSSQAILVEANGQRLLFDQRRIGPAHFSHINFRGTMRFGVEKFAAALIQRAPVQADRVAS